MKTILVPMMLGRLDAGAIEAAVALADVLEARVDVLVGLSAVSPLTAGWDYFPASPYDTLDEAAKAAADAMAADASRLLPDARHAVRVAGAFWLTPAEQTLAAARTADLIVLGRPARAIEADDRLFASTLLDAGRPVVVVPEAAKGRVAVGRVIVAWRPTREATRALHDAIPLLQRAQSVRIVRLLGVAEEGDAAIGVDQELVRHLERHGVRPEFSCLPHRDAPKGERILAFARETAADLIVAGGYGHPRAFEHVFGGVTRTLLRESPVPVFFSH
jgi:nucleotide-binding universal stress UspA family protein